MRIVIDRFEGDYAVLDVDGEMVDFPRRAVPADAKEGTILSWNIVDDAEVLKAAQERLDRLKKRSPQGNSFDL